MIDGLDIITGSVHLNTTAVWLEGKRNELAHHEANKKAKAKGLKPEKIERSSPEDTQKQIEALLEGLGQVRGVYDQLEKNLLLARQKNYDDYKLILELKSELKEAKEQNKNLMDGLE